VALSDIVAGEEAGWSPLFDNRRMDVQKLGQRDVFPLSATDKSIDDHSPCGDSCSNRCDNLGSHF